MAGKMTVHLFKVENINNPIPLNQVLTLINSHSLADRVRDVSSNRIRLEDALAPNVQGNPSRFWLLNFTKFRFENGPGKVGLTTPIEGFTLGDDEGFGEETAALYDPQSDFMIIQYHHSGVRANAIKDYLSFYIANPAEFNGYDLKVKLDPTAEIKLAQKKYINKLKLKIAPANIAQDFRGSNLSLEQVLGVSNRVDSRYIELVLTADRGENLKSRYINPIINYLKNLLQSDISNDTNSVQAFEVSGREVKDGHADAINMLAPKLKLSIDGLMLGGDRRYTIVSRWDGLIRAATGWSGYLK